MIKKNVVVISFFCFAAHATAQQIPKLKKEITKENKTSLIKPFFFMPMNEVVFLKYFDKKNQICDEYEYSQVIFSSKDSSVYSVIEGKVTTIFNVEDIKAVIVQKNKLFFTYSNLKSVLVKKGDKIEANQMIGYAAFDMDGVMPSLDFYMNTQMHSIALSKNNFSPRVKKTLTHFSPMIGTEPE
jgi:hypothetical protein